MWSSLVKNTVCECSPTWLERFRLAKVWGETPPLAEEVGGSRPPCSHATDHMSVYVNWCDLCTWLWTRLKIKTKLFWRQCHPFRGVPNPYQIFTIFGTCCHPHDVIICAKFHVNPFTRFGLARGQIFHFPLWKHSRLYSSLALPGRLWFAIVISLMQISLACTVVQSKLVRIGCLVKGKHPFSPHRHTKTTDPILMKFTRIDYKLSKAVGMRNLFEVG